MQCVFQFHSFQFKNPVPGGQLQPSRAVIHLTAAGEELSKMQWGNNLYWKNIFSTHKENISNIVKPNDINWWAIEKETYLLYSSTFPTTQQYGGKQLLCGQEEAQVYPSMCVCVCV